MKLTRIRLNGYNQFREVEIDLTYPRGHKKEGKPLDKICFLGQSGTGKTSLLRLIKWFVSLKRDIGTNLQLPLPSNADSIHLDFQFFDLNYRMSNLDAAPFLKYEWQKELDGDVFFQMLGDYYKQVKPLLINFPAELLWGAKSPLPEMTDPADELGKLKSIKAPAGLTEPQRIIDFSTESVRKHWEFILETIRSHRAQELLLKKNIADTDIIRTFSGHQKKEQQAQRENYHHWKTNNPDPLIVLAEECLDPLLFNLGLRVKRDTDMESIMDLGTIQLQTLDGLNVPFDFWSTGTRQLVQTVIPLFQLKPQNAMVLIDEPERSLYPDIQGSLIDTYVKLAPECQFFFATHSPIITSAFEPWEIVELKFDSGHKSVSRELHYTGENHVDNYKYFPEYLRWDSILQRIFDLDEEGSKKRLRALEELTKLEAAIEELKAEDKLDTPKGKTLGDRYLALYHKLDLRTGDDD